MFLLESWKVQQTNSLIVLVLNKFQHTSSINMVTNGSPGSSEDKIFHFVALSRSLHLKSWKRLWVEEFWKRSLSIFCVDIGYIDISLWQGLYSCIFGSLTFVGKDSWVGPKVVC